MSTTTPHTQTAYKDTPIGKIPADWEVTDINSLGEVYSGGTPDTNNDSYWNGKINWCTPTDITKLDGSKYIGETIAKITEEGLKNSSAKLLPIGSLIVCTRATIGKAAISTVEISTNQGFKNIVPDQKKANVEYLYYLITNSENRLLKLGNGSTFLEISKNDFEKFKIPLPPLSEQKRIAEVLSTWDQAIQLTEQLIRQKEQRKKWLMQQLLTGKKRLFSSDDLGDISYELQKVKLGEYALIKKGKSLTSSELIEGNIPVIAGGKSSPYKHNAYNHENVITVSASGAYAGFVAYHKGKIWASDCSVVAEIKGKSIINYLYYLLTFNQDKIYKLQTGGAQPHVYPDDIHSLSLIIHKSIKEQTAIAEVLQTADKEIELLKAKSEQLKEQKKGLMQQLLTGRKRLKIEIKV